MTYIVKQHICLTPDSWDKIISNHKYKFVAYLSMIWHHNLFMPCRVEKLRK